jgi:hypothetical protein
VSPWTFALTAGFFEQFARAQPVPGLIWTALI